MTAAALYGDEALRPRLRRLALVPEPAAGEAFHSWFFRIAEAHHITRQQTEPLLGLPPFTALRYIVGNDLFDVHGEQMYFENVRDATGLRAGLMAAMLLLRYGAHRSTRSWADKGENPLSGPWLWRIETPSICPRCIAEPQAAWRIAWHLLPTVACPTHRIYLHGWCPKCRSRISVGEHAGYRRYCNGPYGPTGRVIGAPGCRTPLADLPARPVKHERILDIQQRLTARMTDPCPTVLEEAVTFWSRYELLFRLAVYLATPEMLPPDTDPHVWWAFFQFCQLRDTLALTEGQAAREHYREITHYQPGPILTAAAMLIVDDICPDGDMIEGLRYFMNQRLYDPWQETLWHEFVTQRPALDLGKRTAYALYPYELPSQRTERLHPARHTQEFDLPPAALPLVGEGLLDSAPTRPPHTRTGLEMSEAERGILHVLADGIDDPFAPVPSWLRRFKRSGTVAEPNPG